MINERSFTNAANSKTMNAVEKERLFAAAAVGEENPAKVDIAEFDKTGTEKQAADIKYAPEAEKQTPGSTSKK